MSSESSRLAQLNRLKAKTALRASAQARERGRSASPPSRNGGGKAALNAQPGKESRNAAGKQKEGELLPLEPDKRLGKYFDYDLSKMVNSRGGFLVEDPDDLGEKAAIEKKRKEEREQARGAGAFEPGIDLERGPRCAECNTVEIERKFHDVFGVSVCTSCKRSNEDKYSLLTKGECKEDYLLTDDELKDPDLLPHLLKRNPHGGTFSNMMLFLRMQVEAYAYEKWGSPEALDEEFEVREREKRQRKERKFQKGLRLLRSRTKNNPYQTRMDAEHVHDFTMHREEGLKRCEECGFEVEVELL